MPVFCQKCGIEVDDRGSKIDFIDCCEDCEQEEESVYDGWDDIDTEQLHEWSDEDRHNYYDDVTDYDYSDDDFAADFRELIPDNTFLNWSYGIEKEWWLNGTMPDPRDKDFEREDGKPLWWSDEIDDNPLIHYGQPPAQWDPWV